MLPKAIQIIQTESVLKLLARTQFFFLNGFQVERKFQEIEKYKIRTNQRLRCEMRVDKKNRRRSGYQSAAAAAAALPLLLGVCDVCCTAVMRRLSIDATGGRCAVCAWGVLCDVRVSPQSPKHDE